ncbi:MAG: PD-(D/E)XK nuclease superfamily protein [Microgenomates bacterium OLB22]|nr:MAG: PD-(D/E)XK nuclease superfamily protein [Microgenomates bacterium OLB22]
MLNNAVDHLLKQEFDSYRAQGIAHPLMSAYGLQARPVDHEELEKWRHNFTGIEYTHTLTGITFYGAIDDLWKDTDGKYIVVDYKATAKDYPVTELYDGGWHDSYRRQLEFYQWLLTQKGMNVSKTGYFVYCTAKKDAKAFDAKLEFSINLIPYKYSRMDRANYRRTKKTSLMPRHYLRPTLNAHIANIENQLTYVSMDSFSRSFPRWKGLSINTTT